jgi:hypothetical protein
VLTIVDNAEEEAAAAAAARGIHKNKYTVGSPSSGGRGTESLRRMQRAFALFQPDEDNTITADNVCALLRTLGYRPDVAEVSARFAALNRRLANEESLNLSPRGGGGGRLGAASPATGEQQSHEQSLRMRSATVAAVAGSDSAMAADEHEMHQHAFIQLMRLAENQAADTAAGATSATSAGIAPLGPELEELQGALDRAAAAQHASGAGGTAAPHLLSINALRYRMRVAAAATARANKSRNNAGGPSKPGAAPAAAAAPLSESELLGLLDCAGVVDAAGMPAPSYLRHAGQGYIDHDALVHKLAASKQTKGAS